MQLWVIAALAALNASPLEKAPTWRPVSAQTSAITDRAELDQLASDFPNSATIQRRVLIQAFQVGDRDRALDALERLRVMGYGLSDGAFAQIAGLIVTEETARLQTAARWTRQPIGNSSLVDVLPLSIRLGEGVAFDGKGAGRYLVGSVVDRQLWSASPGGAWEPLSITNLGSVFGLTVDPARRLLWLASGKVEQTPDPATAFVGLVAISLDNLAEVARYAAPADATSLNDIGIGPDGSIYAADGLGGGIYRLQQGATQIEQLIAPNHLRGPQGIAVSADNKRAYLADYGYGIAILDLETGAMRRLSGDEKVMLDGIDGLYWAGRSLVAIQNGIGPQRISRLDLDDSGEHVIRQVTLERANPEWGEPTLGQVVDGAFFYISNPQWDRFGEGGVVIGDAPLLPNAIRSIDLGLTR